VHLTNNLFVLDRVASWYQLIDPAFVTRNNLLVRYSSSEDPGYVDLGFANIEGNNASDFMIVKRNSLAVDGGTYVADDTLDFFNRARISGSAPDIGALEFDSIQMECIPRFPAPSVARRVDPAPPPGRGRY
jgi:hypothetical protein